jgi:FeS assembly SUF system protein
MSTMDPNLALDTLDGPVATPGVPANPEELRARIVEVLQTIYDPEIPVNVYDLGLIYDIAVDADRRVTLQMTLTAPACPEAESLPGYIETRLQQIPGVTQVEVRLVFDPPWTRARMSEAARLALGMF